MDDPKLSKGDAYESAMAEAWVASFQERIRRPEPLTSVEYAEHEFLEWIGFCKR